MKNRPQCKLRERRTGGSGQAHSPWARQRKTPYRYNPGIEAAMRRRFPGRPKNTRED